MLRWFITGRSVEVAMPVEGSGGGERSDEALELRFDSLTHRVSTLSSLLRTLQAAIRETAFNTPAVSDRFVDGVPPVLFVRVGESSEDRHLELRFFFVDHVSGYPENAVSRTVFGAFIDALEKTLKSQPQKSFWGAPATKHVRTVASAGQPARIQQVLDDLGRSGRATLSLGPRQILIQGGSIEIIAG